MSTLGTPPPPSPVPPIALRTYAAIRLGVVAVILALGFAVWREIANEQHGCVQRSLSAYYYTPVRPVFVGALLIIGFAMIVLWGKTAAEDVALNLAGLLLMVVALVPTLDANYCSLPTSVAQTGGSQEKPVADNDLIADNAQTVARSFSSLLVVLALVLVFLAVLGVWHYVTAPAGASPGTKVIAGYAVTWLLAAIAWVVYLVLYLDRSNPDSVFNHQVHSMSANIGVGFVIVAVVLAALEKSRDPDAPGPWWARWRPVWWDDPWTWVYGALAGLMILTVVIVRGGDALGLYSGWLDIHATFVLEAILIGLLGVFWVCQTIDRRHEGAPAY
ncbi:hypothetical protein [Nocardioides mangrovi]|uniref:DUF998 domain-containing protein n=1 Tax=Nocardioides mangrovi TaxID=2874580 RepID=A0ABS7U7D6_9ACTN|nr:hypothetical protein [Nocardioides mangrovi]MBZ5736671.1 hypothetical protein [Nocardioides mangrovi]